MPDNAGIARRVDVISSSGADGTYTNGDFLVGDVLVHSNDGSQLDIVWTAPSTGTISFTTDLWYAHTLTGGLTIQRTNTDSVSLGGTSLGSANVGYQSSVDRSHAWQVTQSNVAVSKGEQLIVALGKNFRPRLWFAERGGDFRKLHPGGSRNLAWAMMLLGFAGLGPLGYRRRRHLPA